MCGCRKAAAAAAGAGATPGVVAQRVGRRMAPAATVAVAPVAFAAAVVVEPEVIYTSIWGPPLWRALHIAAVFSDRIYVRNDWPTLLYYLQESLPCPDCTGHYRSWYSSHPFIRGNNSPDVRKQAHEWLVALHNDVNVRTEKPTMTPDEAAALFGGDRLARIAEAEAAVASLRRIVGKQALSVLFKILQLIKRR